MKAYRQIFRFFLIVVFSFILFGQTASRAQQKEFRIAVVDLNRALNDSQAGKRSKRLLLADKSQMETQLKSEEGELKAIAEELKNNILLSDSARREREREFKDREKKLRAALKSAQKELQDKERRYTESIFTELKTVIGIISRSENYDFVLEKSASQVVLYTSFDMTDITDEVIERYNTIQDGQ